jgi:rubrerythrin
MELKECRVCGEEFPESWEDCPFCDATPRRSSKLDEDDFWN